MSNELSPFARAAVDAAFGRVGAGDELSAAFQQGRTRTIDAARPDFTAGDSVMSVGGVHQPIIEYVVDPRFDYDTLAFEHDGDFQDIPVTLFEVDHNGSPKLEETDEGLEPISRETTLGRVTTMRAFVTEYFGEADPDSHHLQPKTADELAGLMIQLGLRDN